ncbi:FAD-dependent monooxygenase [Catenulispora pinisilvae]|uniref:FAD-dependent monooxygenase n=1 Tax=Catenulispora pinisilvae TaxID=2705253 RepID=UPI0018921180|nr:FAD-dependent monooxygenase [Catenulispora pinisilvae]
MDLDVLVIGGGPVGLMSAALLDAAGVRVEVYERNPGPSSVSKATTMHPRTLEVLSMLELGDGRRVSDVLIGQGRKVPHTHFATLPSRVGYTGLDTPFPFVLMNPQWRTEHALADYLRARSVPVHYGTEVKDVVQPEPGSGSVSGSGSGSGSGAESQGPVVVTLAAGADGTERTVSARYVVGADGAHSMVRHAAGIDFPGNPPTILNFVADVELTETVAEAEYFWRHDAGLVGVMPLPGGIHRVFGVEVGDVGLPADEVRRKQSEPFTLEELRGAMQRVCGTDFGLRAATSLTRASNSSRFAEHYRVGRVLLVGDAAHVHLPAGGQGLNVGLQDATNMAWKLAAELAGWAPDHVISGAAGYEAERHLVARRLLDDTLAQDALMHTFSPAGKALREKFTGFIDRRGEVSEELSGWLSGLAVGYPQPDGSHPLVGTKAPDAVLAGDGLVRSLRPDRFLLLDFGSGDAYAELGGARVEVRAGLRHTGAWATVRAALIRPDGHVAYAVDSAGADAAGELTEAAAAAETAEAVAAWTRPTVHSEQRIPA